MNCNTKWISLLYNSLYQPVLLYLLSWKQSNPLLEEEYFQPAYVLFQILIYVFFYTVRYSFELCIRYIIVLLPPILRVASNWFGVGWKSNWLDLPVFCSNIQYSYLENSWNTWGGGGGENIHSNCEYSYCYIATTNIHSQIGFEVSLQYSSRSYTKGNLSFTFPGTANGRLELSWQNFRWTFSFHILFLASKE